MLALLLFSTVLIGGMNVQAKKKMKPKSLKKAKITLSKSSYTYNGKAKKPAVTVKLGKKKLKKNRDYTVKYTKNKNAGTAKVTIKAKKAKKGKKAKYKGSKSKTFKIKKASRLLVPDKAAYSAVAPKPPIACPTYKPVMCTPTAKERDFPSCQSAINDKAEGIYNASLTPIIARSQ